jgi:MFS family permease
MSITAAGAREGSRDFLAVSTAQFSMAFALNFMFVFLPFYIRSVSPMDEAATLRWTGLILGAAAATATFGSAFWGGLSDRYPRPSSGG